MDQLPEVVAPATVAAVVPSPAAAAPVQAATTSQPVAAPPAATVAAPAAPAAKSAPDFDWDAWDGDLDALPEQSRPVAQKLNARFAKDRAKEQAEIESLRDVYVQLSNGLEDPRIKELQAKLDSGGATAQQARQAYEALKAEHEQFRAIVEQQAETQARAEIDAFKAQHDWIFSDKKMSAAALPLLDEGFEVDDLPVLLKLPAPVLARARELNKELTAKGAQGAGSYAIQLAQPKGPVKTDAGANSDLVSGGDSVIVATPAPARKTGKLGILDAIDHFAKASIRQSR